MQTFSNMKLTIIFGYHESRDAYLLKTDSQYVKPGCVIINRSCSAAFRFRDLHVISQILEILMNCTGSSEGIDGILLLSYIELLRASTESAVG